MALIEEMSLFGLIAGIAYGDIFDNDTDAFHVRVSVCFNCIQDYIYLT